MTPEEEILAVLREIRDQQAEHHAAMLARLRKLDAAAEASQLESQAQQVATQQRIQAAGNRFFVIAAIAIVVFLFLPMIGDLIVSFFDRIFG